MAAPAINTLRGVVEIDNRVANAHPEDWRRDIHKIRPLGVGAPLTVTMDALGSKPTTSRKFHFWVQPFNGYNGALLDVCTDAALGSVYSSGGVDGTVLFLKMTTLNAKLFRIGDQVQVADPTTMGRRELIVTDVNIGTDSTSYVRATLTETDTSSLLAEATPYFTIVGRAEAEVSELVSGLYDDPTEYSNYCQVMMDAAEFSDRERIENERLDPSFAKRQRFQALERMMMKREWSKLFGIYRKSGTTTYSRGLYRYLTEYASGNVINTMTDTTYRVSGSTFLAGGFDQFLNLSEFRMRYSKNTEPLVMTSGLVIRDIQKLMYDRGYSKLETGQTDYGIKVTKLHLSGETWNLVNHPLFSTNAQFRRTMVITEPKLLKTRTLQPMYEVKPGDRVNNGWTFITAEKYGWVVDEGLEMVGFDQHLWLENVGQDQ